jgi:hypothetical protein
LLKESLGRIEQYLNEFSRELESSPLAMTDFGKWVVSTSSGRKVYAAAADGSEVKTQGLASIGGSLRLAAVAGSVRSFV